MNTIPLPERGLTLLPPWPQAIAYADKRLENRSYGVARQLGEWRGLVAIGQSKTSASDWDRINMAAANVEMGHGLREGSLGDPQGIIDAGSKILLVAELLDILPPERCDGAAWHVPGQWGLILGRVWEVEPVPCTGGVGAWTVEWCEVCLRVLADSSRGCPEHRSARRIRNGLARPELRIIRECLA